MPHRSGKPEELCGARLYLCRVRNLWEALAVHFIKLAVTVYESNGARPAIGADDKWINLDQVVAIEEHLGSNSFERGVRDGLDPEEHYPCVQLTTADGAKHLVSLGQYPDQPSAADAIARFLPLLLAQDPTADLM